MLTWLSRLRHHCESQDSRNLPVTPGQRAANDALSRAQADRELMRAQRPAVREQSNGWRRVRENNHLAEMIRGIVLGEGR